MRRDSSLPRTSRAMWLKHSIMGDNSRLGLDSLTEVYSPRETPSIWLTSSAKGFCKRRLKMRPVTTTRVSSTAKAVSTLLIKSSDICSWY